MVSSTRPPSLPVAAILLAAGESTRMGRLKATLPWQGTTLLQYQVESLLSAGVSKVVVVLGHKAETLRTLVGLLPGVSIALNLRYRTGKSGSVRAGLRQIAPQAGHILVLAVDQPRSPGLIRHVMDAHLEHGGPVTYPIYQDGGQGKGGHPVIFTQDLLPEMTKIRESSQGLREVVQRHNREVVRVPMDDPQVLVDLNVPEDYRRAFESG